MTDDEQAPREDDPQTDTESLAKETLEDLDVTTEDGADVKGGVPKLTRHCE